MTFALLAFVLVLAGWTAPSPGWDECVGTQPGVREAIQEFTRELLDRRDPDRDWEPAQPISGEIQQANGRTALSLLALLEVGRSMQEPGLDDALARLLGAECNGIYALSLRIMLLARLPRQYHRALEQDVAHLLDGFDMTVNGWGYRTDSNRKRMDNSTTQFAALALRDAADAGVRIPPELWHRLQVRFLSIQLPDGGWDYSGNGRPRASMGAAAVATLAIVRRQLHRDAYDKGASRDVLHLEDAIQRGLAWLERHFDPRRNFGHAGHVPYYLFAIERAAHATGRVAFNGAPWFSKAAEVLVKRGTRPNTPDLALTLLFLKRGLIPDAIAELEGEPELRRPLAVSELTKLVSERLETNLGWIRIDDVGAWEARFDALPSVILVDLYAHPGLLDSPTGAKFTFLRRALRAGCTAIISVPGARGRARKAGESLHMAMPGTELRPLDRDDPILSDPWHVRAPPPAFKLTNGVRTLAILVAGDPARALQRGGRDQERVLDLLANTWLRGHGGTPPEPRQAPSPRAPEAPFLGTIVHLSPSGVDLPEPGALPTFAQRHATNGRGPVAFIPGVLGSVTPDPTWTLAIISGTRAWDPSEQEWAAIEELLRHDVPVLVETTGGRGDFARSFATAFETHWERRLEPVEELRSILGEETECDLDLEEIGWTSSALEHLGTGKHAHHLERAPMAYPAPLLVARFDLTHALLGRPALDVLGWRTPWVDALLERFMRRSAS